MAISGVEIRFEWDIWNRQKNDIKHGVSAAEAESVFFDPDYQLFSDIKHSTPRERRYLIYGKSAENRVLSVGFTLRGERIRVITARQSSRKERDVYEKKTTSPA